MSKPSASTQERADTKPGAGMGRPMRFVTAAALYDGHDASINIIRRMLIEAGVGDSPGS